MEPWTLPVLDHPWMQRLRRVHQLGTAHLVYPGAHHKRFEHSLGAYHLARQFGESVGLPEEDRLTLQAAALVHDVGHGPFSHAFERVSGARHELRTVDLVQWGPLGDLLRKGGVDPVAVADTVLGRGPLASVVSGALDADRMDYLLRDCHFTGVRASVDVQRLFGAARIHPEAGLVLRESGLVAAEGLLTTRFLLYPSVYLHHTVRAADAMLIQALQDLRDRDLLDPARAIEWSDDQLVWYAKAQGGLADDLMTRLLERRLYKRAASVPAARIPAAALESLRTDPDQVQAWAQTISDAAGVPEAEVLLDLPKPPKYRETDLQILTRDGDLESIQDRSTLIRTLGQAHLDHWTFWVFTPNKHRAAVEAAAKRLLPDLGLVA